MTSPARTAAMPLLVLLGLTCQEAGAAVAVLIMPEIGPWGVIAMRLLFSAVVLLPLAAVSLRRGAIIHWPTVVMFGIADRKSVV